METSCGLRVMRKSTMTSTMTAPMVSAQSVGVPIDWMAVAGSAAAGAPAASRDEGKDVNTGLLKTELRS